MIPYVIPYLVLGTHFLDHMLGQPFFCFPSRYFPYMGQFLPL